LRSDFFIGSAQWGVRLNEVAYGCGVDYRNETEDGHIVDDAPAIAHILQEGMMRCQMKCPADKFLRKLGASGNTYADTRVAPVPVRRRQSLPPSAHGLGMRSRDNCIIPDELCRTVHHQTGRARGSSWCPGQRQERANCRSQSWYAGAPQPSPRLPAALVKPRTESFHCQAAQAPAFPLLSFPPLPALQACTLVLPPRADAFQCQSARMHVPAGSRSIPRASPLMTPRCESFRAAAPRCESFHAAAPRCESFHSAAPRCESFHSGMALHSQSFRAPLLA